jgi:alkylhydroperoxidase/carboxymuconolactone decarboxylase family protein YurZ
MSSHKKTRRKRAKRAERRKEAMAVEYPRHFLKIREKYPQLIEMHERAGELGRKAGPLQDKYTHLVQMAACVALRSEGGVHSHTRRALEAGATPEEIYHALILLISTTGFPTVSAGFSWVNDVIEKKAR